MTTLVLPVWVPASELLENVKGSSMTSRAGLTHVLESVCWPGWEASSLDREQMISSWTPGNEAPSLWLQGLRSTTLGFGPSPRVKKRSEDPEIKVHLPYRPHWKVCPGVVSLVSVPYLSSPVCSREPWISVPRLFGRCRFDARASSFSPLALSCSGTILSGSSALASLLM